MASIFIYALCEPETLIVRYIGKTVDPKRRLRQHLRSSSKKRTHLGNWLRRVISEGALPQMEIIRVTDIDGWKEVEESCIQLAKDLGYSLVNLAKGGFGGNGLKGREHFLFGKRGSECPRFGQKHSEETKRILSLQKLGKKLPPRTPEHGKAIGDALRKRYGRTPSILMRGFNLSPIDMGEFSPDSRAYQRLSLFLRPQGFLE